MEKFTVTYKDLKDESTGSTRVIIVNAENAEQAKQKVSSKMRDVRVFGAHPTEMSDKRKGVPELKEAVDNKELLAHQQKVAVAKTTEEEQEPVFADATRNFEKTAKVKAETVKVEKAPEHNEKPKRPKMVPEAKKMHLDESLFEESKVVDFDKVFPVVQEWLGDLLGQDDLESAAQSIAIALTRNSSDVWSTVRRSLMPYIRNVVAFEEIEGIVPSIEDAVNGITEARVGKTKEIKVLQGNYGYGWDDLIEYDVKDFNGNILDMNKEIKNDLRDYRENERDASHRVITRRVPVENLKESLEVPDEAYQIADMMDKAFEQIGTTITMSDFEEQLALACFEVYGIDDIWNPVYGDERDLSDDDLQSLETDIRGILSYKGWETVLEGENEGGLQKLTESLNEGAGAGYRIKGSLSDIKINSINDVETFEGESAFGTKLTFARIDLDADATFTGTAESYYYGGSIEGAKVKITSIEVNPNLIYDLHLEEFEYDKVTLEDLQDRLGYGSEIRFESDVIGGGWTHSTFDGNVIASRIDDDYKPYIDGVAFNFIDKHIIEYIDRAVQEDDDEIDYDYADDMEDGYWEDKFNESLDSELADTFGYTYGISKSEARKRVAGLSKEEKQKKLDLLKNGIKRNAKADFYETQPSKLTEGAKSFLRTLGRDDIQYFTHKNRFNYDLKQIRIDNKNKTYEYGNFAWTNRLESTQNGKEFERLVDKLKEMGYTEVKKSLKERFAKRK